MDEAAADRRANKALAVQIVWQAIVFFVLYAAWDRVVDTFTVTRLIVLVIVVLGEVALVALSITRQARQFGGRQQLRAFNRAIISTGTLPPDAGRAAWRRSLMATKAWSRPWRMRAQWFAFMLSIGATQALARGETGWVDLVVVLVIGLVVGGITGQVMVSRSRDRLTRVHHLLDQIDGELTRDPA